MTKYIKYHKEYTKFGEAYQLVLPLNLEGLVPDDDSVEDQRFFNISDTFCFFNTFHYVGCLQRLTQYPGNDFS